MPASTVTDFWLYHTDSELRRKGRMTRHQRRRRAELEEKLGRPDPQAIRKDVQHLLEVVLQKAERIGLPARWHEYYDRAVTTREFRTNRHHELHYAY